MSRRTATLTSLLLSIIAISAAGQSPPSQTALELDALDVVLRYGSWDGTGFFEKAAGHFTAIPDPELPPLTTVDFHAVDGDESVAFEVEGPPSGMVYLLIDAYVRDGSMGGNQQLYDSLVGAYPFLKKSPTINSSAVDELVYVDEALVLDSILQPMALIGGNQDQAILSFFQPLFSDGTASTAQSRRYMWSIDNSCWDQWDQGMTSWWDDVGFSDDPGLGTNDHVSMSPEALWQRAIELKSGGTTFPAEFDESDEYESLYKKAVSAGLGLTIQAIVLTSAIIDPGGLVSFGENMDLALLPGLPGAGSLPNIRPRLSAPVHLSINSLAVVPPIDLGQVAPFAPQITNVVPGGSPLLVSSGSDVDLRIRYAFHGVSSIRYRDLGTGIVRSRDLEYSRPGFASFTAPPPGTYEIVLVDNSAGTVTYPTAGGLPFTVVP